MKPTLAPTHDVEAMARLARALTFICGADDPTTLAMLKAAASGEPSDVQKARALFAKLKPGNRAAALVMIAE